MMEISQEYTAKQKFWATRSGIAVQLLAWLVLALSIALLAVPGISILLLVILAAALGLMTVLLALSIRELLNYEKHHHERHSR